MADAPFIFDRESSRAVDRAAIAEYGIPGIVLMENASRAIAGSALDLLRDHDTKTILIVCGAGNNGGDGYAAARHLHNAGCDVTLCAVGEPRDATDAAINRTICERMRLKTVSKNQLVDGPRDAISSLTPGHVGPALVIDALFGTGLDRPVEGEAARIIQWMNEARQRGSNSSLILAADIPSGLDCDIGRELGIAVRAHRTVSFLGRKKGFLQRGADAFTGEVVVGDIGAPVELLERFALNCTPGRRT